MRSKRVAVAAAMVSFGLALYGALLPRAASAGNAAYAQSGTAGMTDPSTQPAPRLLAKPFGRPELLDTVGAALRGEGGRDVGRPGGREKGVDEREEGRAG